MTMWKIPRTNNCYISSIDNEKEMEQLSENYRKCRLQHSFWIVFLLFQQCVLLFSALRLIKDNSQ